MRQHKGNPAGKQKLWNSYEQNRLGVIKEAAEPLLREMLLLMATRF